MVGVSSLVPDSSIPELDEPVPKLKMVCMENRLETG